MKLLINDYSNAHHITYLSVYSTHSQVKYVTVIYTLRTQVGESVCVMERSVTVTVSVGQLLSLVTSTLEMTVAAILITATMSSALV